MHHLIRHLGSALAELRRRRVFHVVVFYGVVAWLVVQITHVAVPALYLPPPTLTIVFFVALLGFPVVAVLAWVYDLTPGGIERTDADEASDGEVAAFGEGLTPGHLTGDPTDPVAALRRLGRPAGEGAEPTVEPEALSRTGPPIHPRAIRFARLVLAGGVLVVTAALGWIGWQFWFEAPAQELQAADPVAEFDPKRIAVLYFDDHSEAGDLDHLAHGLTEALIHELAQVPALDVVSRFGVKPFRGTEVTVDSIVRALRVGSLVEGSVQRSGDRLRVTVQLVDGATNSHLDSETLERPMGELFALQDDLVLRVGDILRRTLGTELRLRGRRAETESVEAWTAVHRAETLREDADWLAGRAERVAAERLLDRADSLFAAAEALDPAWLEPILLRGWTAADRARTGPMLETHDAAWYRTGLNHVERALRIQPVNPQALELRGVLRFRLSQTGDVEDSDSLLRGAETDLRAAVSRDPALARAWAELSELLRREGGLEEAKWTAERALSADAFLTDIDEVIRRLYQTSLDLRDFDEAVRWCDQGRQRFDADRRFVACGLFLLALEGGPEPDVDRAWRLLEQFVDLSPPAAARPNRIRGTLWVAAALARAANKARATADDAGERRAEWERTAEILADSARAVARRAEEGLTPGSEPPALYHYYQAHVQLLLNEREEALRFLQLHLAALPGSKSRVATDWIFKPLWEDPRFQALVAEPAEDSSGLAS